MSGFTDLASGTQKVATYVWDATANAGALVTTTLSSSARQVGRGQLRSVIPAVGDEFMFTFGATESAGQAIISTAAAIRQTVQCAPIILGPQQFASLGLWFPGNATTAGSFEVEAGWWER